MTVLPHGPGASSVGTVGGWQLGVSKFSKHKPAAIEFVRYMASPAVERFNAITNSNVPTIPAVAKLPAVRVTNPYLKPEIATVARVTRPSRYLKGHYNEGSKIIYQGINQILNGAGREERPPGDPVPAEPPPEVTHPLQREGWGLRLPPFLLIRSEDDELDD